MTVASTTIRPTAPARILVVDDDRQIIHLTRLILESHGYACLTANTGAQGLSRFTEANVDLIITDLHMGIGDGITFIEAVRQKSQIPIAIVSGFAREWSYRLHVLDNVRIFAKPIEMAALLKHVHSCCGPRTLPWNRWKASA